MKKKVKVQLTSDGKFAGIVNDIDGIDFEFEYKDNCPYCDNKKHFSPKDCERDFGMSAWISPWANGTRHFVVSRDKLCYRDSGASSYTFDTCQINYCPMCGRKF